MDFALLESVPDAMVIVGHGAGRIVYVNRLAEGLFGYSSGELIGQSIEILLPARLRETHRAQREAYGAAPRTRPMGVGLDLVGVRKNGEEFVAEISLAPMLADGEHYVVAAVRDVTERKKIEHRAQLYRKAQEQVQKRDEFLSIASHELRTPLTALQLKLQLLRRASVRAEGFEPGALLQKIESLERETRRIALLVNELLDLSRMRRGSLELKLDQIDLTQLVREAVDRLREEAEAAGCELALRVETPAVGRWDRLRLEQVVTNLVVNAIKFGGGKPITVSVDADPNLARVAVEDHGIGIPAEDHARVFGRFERGVPAGNYAGLGLGLYITSRIVEAHGGAISLKSAPGAGSTFTVALPRLPQRGARG